MISANNNDLELFQFIKRNGYENVPSFDNYLEFHKRVPSTVRECETNGHKLCFFVKVHYATLNYIRHCSVSFGITGELGEKWWQLECYAMSEQEFISELSQLEKHISGLWNHLGLSFPVKTSTFNVSN